MAFININIDNSTKEQREEIDTHKIAERVNKLVAAQCNRAIEGLKRPSSLLCRGKFS